MPSCPLPRPSCARAAPPARRALLALSALLLAACSSTADDAATAPAAERGAPTQQAARELSFTATSEIRFDGELVGYLVEVQPVPEGTVDSRPWEPGTALIQDKRFQFIGFISPRGTTYRFDEDETAQAVGFGSRSAGIAAFFRRNGEPQLVSVHGS
jgi:hypothetical protein